MSDELAEMRAQAARAGGVSVNQPVTGRMIFGSDGTQRYEGGGVNRVNVAIPNPKTVFVNGIETSREAAELNGWVPDGAQNFPQAAANKLAAQSGGQENEPQPYKPQQTADDAAWQQTQDATNATLNKLYDARGKEAADTLEKVIEGGDLAAALEQGFDAGDVNSIVAGFTAYADREMKAQGVNVALLNEVLDNAQLAEARRAVANQDVSRLRSIAEDAKSRLADWPERNPEQFSRFFNENFADIGRDLAADGTFLVKIEGVGLVPWATAVRLGAVQIKGAAPQARTGRTGPNYSNLMIKTKG